MSGWLTVEDIVAAAFREPSREELRRWLLERLVTATGAIGGAFIDLRVEHAETFQLSQELLADVRARLMHATKACDRPNDCNDGARAAGTKSRRVPSKLIGLAGEVQFTCTSTSRASAVFYGKLGATRASEDRWICLCAGSVGFSREVLDRVEVLLLPMALADTAHAVPSAHGSRDTLAELTERQRQICEYVALGYSNLEIAAACGLREPTVRNHLVRLCHRFRVRTRTELIARVTQSARMPSDRVGALTLQARAAVMAADPPPVKKGS